MEQPQDNLVHRIIGPRLVTVPRPPVCGACRSDAVAVADWNETNDGRLCVVLRCGQCETWHELVVSDDAADRLVKALDAGLAAIASDLEAVERERMAAEIEVFVQALARDLIDAEDFKQDAYS